MNAATLYFRRETLIILFCFLLGFNLAQAEDQEQKGDSLFDGQVLSLTQPKEPLKPSNDARFTDNRDGTVTDEKSNLMWKKVDAYQEQKKWTNWNDANRFVAKMNESKFAGFQDWRLPTRHELQTLYEHGKSIPWNYYWTVNEVHMDPIFGYASCCFWSSELYKDEYAWSFNYIRGKAYPSPKGGPGLSLSTFRPVRSINIVSSAQETEKTP